VPRVPRDPREPREPLVLLVYRVPLVIPDRDRLARPVPLELMV